MCMGLARHWASSSFHLSFNRATVLADTGTSSPSSPHTARSKSPSERPCRYNLGISAATGSRTPPRCCAPVASSSVSFPNSASASGVWHIRSGSRCPVRVRPASRLRPSQKLRHLLLQQLLDQPLDRLLTQSSSPRPGPRCRPGGRRQLRGLQVRDRRRSARPVATRRHLLSWLRRRAPERACT